VNGNAFKAEATVGPGGKVELNQPLPPGTAVEVIVFVPGGDDFSDLVAAAESSLGFWDNPLDVGWDAESKAT